KLQSEALREAIAQMFTDAKEKKRNFTEIIELRIGLKNYDPQKPEGQAFQWVFEIASYPSAQDEDLNAWRCSACRRGTL
ncbi:60S ribosomal L10a, partial [Olea europaea subsp. europaea]